MHLRNSEYIYLLIPFAILFIRKIYRMNKGVDSPKIGVSSARLISENVAKIKISPRIWPYLFYLVGIIFLIYGLARPQHVSSKIKRTVDGIDIVIVLDLSASMRVEDFRDKNRIETSKPILKNFINKRVNDRIGFQTFSGEAVTLVPPTLDHQVVNQALEDAEIGDLKDGTAIGDALATAVGRLKESRSPTRVIVLVTDGDSNVGQVDPIVAGELAKGFGIKVYSVAIGRDGRVSMPFIQKDVFGRAFKAYQYFDSSINPELLQKISTITGGKFYRVQDDAKEFAAVFKDIDQLEKYKIEMNEQIRFDEKFLKYVWPGLLLILCGFLLQNTVLRVYPWDF